MSSVFPMALSPVFIPPTHTPLSLPSYSPFLRFMAFALSSSHITSIIYQFFYKEENSQKFYFRKGPNEHC